MQKSAPADIPDIVKWALSTVLAVTGIIVGVWQFNVAEGNRAIYEQRSKLWMNKLEACKATSSIAGELVATMNEDARFNEAVREFKKAYWGSMILVEDAAVRNAMLDLDHAIADLKDGNSSSLITSPEQVLIKRAEGLSAVCRALVEKPPKLSYPWPFGEKS